MNCVMSREFEESQRLLFGEYCDVKNMMNRADACAMMHYYLDALQLDIGKLKYVHVTGSKGKGTTCTYIEKTLRLHGLKTGDFYYWIDYCRIVHISPHSIYL